MAKQKTIPQLEAEKAENERKLSQCKTSPQWANRVMIPGQRKTQ